MVLALLGAMSSCVPELSFESVSGREAECAPWPQSDDLDQAGCDEAVRENWRCAVSANAWRDENGEPVAISQVCRWSAWGGEQFWAWRTYPLFPSDCGTCTGVDPMIPDGCEPSAERRWYVMPECAPYEEPEPEIGIPEDDDAWAPGPDDGWLPEEDNGGGEGEWVPDEEPQVDEPEPEPQVDEPPQPGVVDPGVVGVDGVAAFDALSAGERAELRARRLFWGHQSVGENLIEGSSALGYDWSQVSNGSDYDWANWGHGTVDDNGDPWRKIRSFRALLSDAGIADRVDAAAFKFCWIDFEPETNVEALLAEYEAALADLSRQHPAVRFLHVTPPLTSDDAARNAVRLQYGRRLIEDESDTGVVLDLAAIESTDSAGRACTLGGVRRLCDEWRDDEGHLNDNGKARAAKAFLTAFSRLF